MATFLPVPAAAVALGVSISSVRRGLKSGRLRGQRQATKQGHQWLVEVPDDQADQTDDQADNRVLDQPDDRVRDQPATRVPEYPSPDAPTPTTLPNLAQRAEDMAVYSHRLLAPYVEQIAAQAERIGRLELELAMAKAGDHGGDPRPWWAFWR